LSEALGAAVQHSIVMLIPYFGKWPVWFNFFIETCKWNRQVDWYFITDCEPAQNIGKNIFFLYHSYSEYISFIKERLKIRFDPKDAYKLCDIKPCLGFLHKDQIEGYDFFGFCDIDVIFGNIANIYTEELLSKSNVLSTHPHVVSGHFTLLRNTKRYREAFRVIKGWEELLERPHHIALDENRFTRVFLGKSRLRFAANHLPWINPYWWGRVFVERHSTILAPWPWHDGSMDHPMHWFWKNGRLTNDRDGDREFLYLHFMNLKSSRYLPKSRGLAKAPWEELPKIVSIDWVRAASEGFAISPKGIHAIDALELAVPA
jgi:hypothetical protein